MTDNKLEEAIEYFDLDGWLQEYSETLPGGGDEVRVQICPVCGNSGHKLYVNVSKKRWLCYVCDWGRGLADVAVLMSQVSGQTMFEVRKELLASLKPLAPRGDLETKLSAMFSEQPQAVKEEVVAGLEVPGTEAYTGSIGNMVLGYARGRGLTDDEIIKYRLRPAYKLRYFTGPFLLFPNYLRGRICVSWQGRRTGPAEPRYVSSDDVAQWLWPLDTWAEIEIARRGEVVLVEGVFDAAGMWRLDMPAMATYGKKISDRQIALLLERGVHRITLAWDADSARTSSQRLARGARHMRGEIEMAALRLAKNFDVRVIDFSKGAGTAKLDPGDALRDHGAADWVRERVASAMQVGSDEFYMWRLS